MKTQREKNGNQQEALNSAFSLQNYRHSEGNKKE